MVMVATPRYWWQVIREEGPTIGFDTLEEATEYANANRGTVLKIVKAVEVRDASD